MVKKQMAAASLHFLTVGKQDAGVFRILVCYEQDTPVARKHTNMFYAPTNSRRTWHARMYSLRSQHPPPSSPPRRALPS
jgi:hypothetical protein